MPNAKPDREARREWSVSGLTAAIKSQLEANFGSVWIRGEVSNLRVQASGHSYFTLKDAGAQISAVLFRGDAARSGCVLRDGQEILGFGEVSVYEARGSYQVVLRQVMDAGAGRLQAEFERLKLRLQAEGLFDPAAKQPIPQFPRRVGFITSPSGAAVQDFCSILQRRDWRGEVVVLPAKVQGAEAAGELVAMLRLAERLELDLAGGPVLAGGVGRFFDLLVIGRGGGSLEDLWCFNDEALVRAVAACSLPIISAVGHEIDFTLCDFAADLRAETPSAAAERISQASSLAAVAIGRMAASLRGAAQRAVSLAGERFGVLGLRLGQRDPLRVVEAAAQRVDDLGARSVAALSLALANRDARLQRLSGQLRQQDPRVRIARACGELQVLLGRLEVVSPEFRIAAARERLRGLASTLEALGPESIKRRGYAILRDRHGRALSTAAQARAAVDLRLSFADGDLRARVEADG